MVPVFGDGSIYLFPGCFLRSPFSRVWIPRTTRTLALVFQFDVLVPLHPVILLKIIDVLLKD